MSGVFNLKPSRPKLNFVWDVDILIRYFEQGDNSSLPSHNLTQKLLALLYC